MTDDKKDKHCAEVWELEHATDFVVPECPIVPPVRVRLVIDPKTHDGSLRICPAPIDMLHLLRNLCLHSPSFGGDAWVDIERQLRAVGAIE